MSLAESKTKENLLCHLQIDESDSTAADHLSALLGEVLRTEPKDAFQNLEKLSAFLKQNKFHPLPAPDMAVSEPFIQAQKQAMETLARSKIPYTGKAHINNFTDDTAMLQWAGIGFGEQLNYDISLRIRALAQSLGESLVKLKFWGKILGTRYDYLIAEGQLVAPAVDVYTDIEPRGKGGNLYSYWALSSKSGSEWEMLPNVRPSWITTSRSIRKYMTGDLDAPVLGFVTFEGRERDYLRSVIARISASCTLAPAGSLVLGEEDGAINKNDEFEFPTTEELKAQAAWIHAREHLLQNGLTKYPEVDPEADEQRAKEIEQQKENDPAVAALRGISEDVPTEEGASAGWHISQVGDPSSYNFDSLQKSYAVTVLRSTRWPGAATVSQGKRYCNVYVGYGLRDSGSCFLPQFPGDIQEEPKDDGEEADEPNPEEEVVSDQASEDEKPVEE